jgi:hypothetical protein
MIPVAQVRPLRRGGRETSHAAVLISNKVKLPPAAH